MFQFELFLDSVIPVPVIKNRLLAWICVQLAYNLEVFFLAQFDYTCTVLIKQISNLMDYEQL